MADEMGISRRHALRLAFGQGGAISRERDRIALELDQAAALEGAQNPPQRSGGTETEPAPIKPDTE